MAQNDIEFTGEIRLDTTKAKQDLASLAKEVNNVFQKTGDLISNALTKRKNFGFSALNAPYYSGLQSIENIYSKQVQAANKRKISVPDNATWAEKQLAQAINESINKDITNAGAAIGKLKDLRKFMYKASKYDNLYSNIATLQGSAAGDDLDPATGLGRYGVYQRYANRFLGTLYAGNYAFPNIIGQAALERGEYNRDINRKSGSTFRSALRYIQDTSYTKSSLARARNFMLLDSDNTVLQQLNDIYDMGMTPTDKKAGRYSQKAFDALKRWAETGISAQKHKEALDAGNLTKSEKAYHLAGYSKDMRDFIAMQKKLFPEEKTIAENLKKLNQADLTRFRGGAMKDWFTILGGSALANKILQGGVSMLESYWGESIPRNVYASKQAYYKRWEIGGGVAGTAGGAALGGLLGSIVPGIGTMLGAGIGAAIGNALGPLYGQYKQTKVQSDVVSTNAIIQRIRNQSLYGANYNSWFAQAMTDITGGNGMAELADKSMSLRARMMLGQVSEYDMLYYSMMPNYYAALMSGVTGERLASIYASDLKAIGDPSMRYVVGQAIGGTNAYAMANSKYFGAAYGKLAGYSRQYEEATKPLEPGYASSLIRVGVKNIEKQYKELGNTANRGDIDFYTSGNPYSWVSKFANTTAGQLILGTLGIPSGLVGKTGESVAYSKENGITFVNIITLDGEEIKKDIKTADEVYIDSWSQYSGA